MAGNLARNLERVEEQRVVKKVRRKHRKHAKITKGEKVFLFLFAIALVYFSVQIISNQAAIYQVNSSIQTISQDITEQTRINEELKAQVEELSELERLMNEAKKQGLTPNSENVKVVKANE